MKKIRYVLFGIFMLTANTIFAQDGKAVIIHLKTGYSVKGVIVEQTDQHVKIKTAGGDIFDYKTDEIENGKIEDATMDKTSGPKPAVSKINNVNDKIISVSVGFGGMIFYNAANKYVIPPIPISFEYIIKDDLFNGSGGLGLGGFLGYSSANSSYYGKYSKLFIGARGYFHYTFVNKLDTYGGLFLGYRNETSPSTFYPDENFSEGAAALNVFAGCRYYLTGKFAVSAEVGWGISIVTVGAAYKF